MSTDNIFQRCQQKSRVAHFHETNPLQQLEVVGNFVSDLGAVLKEWRQHQGFQRTARPNANSRLEL